MPWVDIDFPRLREQVTNYYNCLERLDVGVALLLKALAKTELADNTIVVYFGDHGAQFPRGKGAVYEGGLRIPLIVRWPGNAKPGTDRNELVSTVDLLPTVLATASLDAPVELPGRALQPLLRGDASPAWREYNFGFTTGSFPRACFVQHAIRDQRFKLISSPRPLTENLDAGTYLDEQHQHFVVSGATAKEQAAASPHVRQAFARWSRPPRYELYDLQQDPNEWHDLADDLQHAKVKERLIAALRDWQQQTRDPFIDEDNVDAFVNEQLANRDLGYRKKKDFRWSYLDDFPKWRNNQLTGDRQ